jgi:hypothetical protein
MKMKAQPTRMGHSKGNAKRKVYSNECLYLKHRKI